MNPFEVLFRAVHQVNSGLQGTQGVIGTTSRYKESTVGKVYVAYTACHNTTLSPGFPPFRGLC